MKGYNDIVAELLNDHPQILKHIKSSRRVLILKIIMVEIAIAVIAYALRDRQIAMLCFCIIAGIGAPILFLKPFRYFKGGYSGCIERVEVVIRRVDVTKEKAVRSDGYRAMQDRAFIVCDSTSTVCHSEPVRTLAWESHGTVSYMRLPHQ